MHTITFATQKGGSGKSTLAVGLAVAAMQDGERVFVLDTDRQGTLANWGARRAAPEPGVEHVSDGYMLDRLLRGLRRNGYTLAIIDTAGNNDPSTIAAIRAADLCLIPARPGVADIEATHPTLYEIRRAGKDFAFVLNQTPKLGRRLSRAAETLHRYGVLALPFMALRNDHQDALAAGLGVTEYVPNGRAAEEIRALWAWVKGKRDARLLGNNQATLAATA
jgi:chromosome partitioning protein